MWMTQGEALERVARATAKNAKDIRQENAQRRNQVVDLYGVEYYRQGDANYPATFYISISPDMVYMERFEFKLIIQAFASTAGTVGEATVTVDPTSLSGESGDPDVRNEVLSLPEGSGISPNPHSHTTQPHTHAVTSGMSMIPTTASDFRVSVEGIDVTPYLMAQYDAWISGEGVYPMLDVAHNYDLLQVASDLLTEGEKAKADTITRAGYKKIEISSGSPFSVVLVLYSKYSHLNR